MQGAGDWPGFRAYFVSIGRRGIYMMEQDERRLVS